MKNETKAEKIIRKEIEQYSILKPTSMAKDIIKALTEANLISANVPVKRSVCRHNWVCAEDNMNDVYCSKCYKSA